jgi:hypothetical protein
MKQVGDPANDSHPGPETLERFARGELASPLGRGVIRHLLHGPCAVCGPVLDRYLNPPAALAAYDTAVRMAFANVASRTALGALASVAAAGVKASGPRRKARSAA